MTEPAIQLFLSGKPWDGIYRTADGRVVYKASPDEIDVKIARFIPSILDRSPAGGGREDSKNTFGHVARIECHMHRAVRIKMRNLDVATSDYLKPDKSGFWTSLSNDHVFTGPDGKEYVWSLGNTTKLFLKDSARTPVARYYPGTFGLIGEARPAMLEISAAGKDMSDIIIVTCICMEILRAAKRDMV